MLTRVLNFFARWPLAVLHMTGAVLGWLVWSVDRRYRARLAGNLLGSGLARNERDYNRLLRASIAQHGMGAMELLAAWGRPSDAIARLVRQCNGWQLVEDALAARRPILLVTPHLGGFDVGGRYVSTRLPYPVTAMYRPPRLAWLEPLMQGGRARDNIRTAPATAAGVRVLMRALKSGEASLILPDQAPGGGEGVWAPFFGRSAYTMTLLARLAVATDATVLFFFAERLAWGRGFIVHIAPMLGQFKGDRQADAATLNRNVEALIARAPAQYLWSYNRYKHPAGAPLPDEATA